jgi:hypothetical protein
MPLQNPQQTLPCGMAGINDDIVVYLDKGASEIILPKEWKEPYAI